MKFKFGKLTTVIFIMVLTMFSVIIIRGLDLRPSAPKASCEIYEALYVQKFQDVAKYPYFLKSYTSLGVRYGNDLPANFSIETGQHESIYDDILKETYQRPILEERNFDTSEFFEDTLNKKVHSIKKCNFNQSKLLKFFDGELASLNLKEKVLKRGDVFPTIVSLSNVAISPGGKHGLVYIETYCGGLCGWGGYILFEKTDKGWEEFGSSIVWVS